MTAKLVGGELMYGSRCIVSTDDHGELLVLVAEPVKDVVLLHDKNGESIRVHMSAIPMLRRVLLQIAKELE